MPQLVVINVKLSLLTVKWNTNGDKFVAGSCCNKVLVGYFSEEFNWWKAENFKFHKSAVTSVDFDPSGQYIVSGSTDLKMSIFSSFLSSIDKPLEKNNFTTKDSNNVIL